MSRQGRTQTSRRGGAVWHLTLGALLLSLLLAGLGRPSLWEDEAASAVLSARILAHGLPYAWDGHSWVTRERGMDANDRGIWIFEPWVALYVTAASLDLCGRTRFGARFLPAIAGLLAVWVVCTTLQRHSTVQRTPRFAAALFATSVPYLLYCRQSRYYSLVFLSEALFIYTFMDLRWGLRPVAACSLALLLLFYTHPLNFAIFLPAALAGGATFGRARLASVATCSGIALVGALPWVFYSGMLNLGAAGTGFSGQGAWGLRSLAAHALTSLYTPYYLVGCGVVVLCLPLLRPQTIHRLQREPLLKAMVPLLVLPAGVATYLTAANVSSASERYGMTTLIPGLVLLSLILGAVAEDRPRLGYALLLLFAVTPFGMVSPVGINETLPTLRGAPLRSPLWAFVQQCAQPGTTPTDAIVRFLRPRIGTVKRPVLFVDWNPEGVMFDLPSVQTVRSLPFRMPPQWIVLRSGSPTILDYTLMGHVDGPPPDRRSYVLAARRGRMEAAPDYAYLLRYVRSHRYHAVRLRADLPDDNMPEFFQHHFGPEEYPVHFALYEYEGGVAHSPARTAAEVQGSER